MNLWYHKFNLLYELEISRLVELHIYLNQFVKSQIEVEMLLIHLEIYLILDEWSIPQIKIKTSIRIKYISISNFSITKKIDLKISLNQFGIMLIQPELDIYLNNFVISQT